MTASPMTSSPVSSSFQSKVKNCFVFLMRDVLLKTVKYLVKCGHQVQCRGGGKLDTFRKMIIIGATECLVQPQMRDLMTRTRKTPVDIMDQDVEGLSTHLTLVFSSLIR